MRYYKIKDLEKPYIERFYGFDNIAQLIKYFREDYDIYQVYRHSLIFCYSYDLDSKEYEGRGGFQIIPLKNFNPETSPHSYKIDYPYHERKVWDEPLTAISYITTLEKVDEDAS